MLTSTKHLKKLVSVALQTYFSTQNFYLPKVYILQDKYTGEKFASKVFNKQRLDKKSLGKESLINEINLLREINHESLLKLIEVFESEHSYYMITELYSGGTLL